MSFLADWLRRQAPAWLEASSPLTLAQRRALLAITRCRTPALGGHVYRCADCTRRDFAYHSCNHRACPRCGGADTAAWTAKQTERLLPVPYFLVTFTVPEELRFAFKARPKLMHDLLFTHAARALQTIADDPRHLGAALGMVGVLHTWGRQMQHHPHLHFIVAGGGVNPAGKAWINSRRPDWLLPGDAVAGVFRRGMEVAMHAVAPELHAQLAASVWRAGWWVHTEPAGNGANVVKYLARYVGRTAISDERIVAMNDETVTLRYPDTKTKERRECTLSAHEFMRRYLQHVLPPGQHRVRYFGWMHPSAKARRMKVETLLAVPIVVVAAVATEAPAWHLRCHTVLTSPSCASVSCRARPAVRRFARDEDSP